MKSRDLETIRVRVPEAAAAAYAAALEPGSLSLARFTAGGGMVEIEAVHEHAKSAQLALGLTLAAAATGVTAEPERTPTALSGWLARVRASFPESRIGRRFLIRPSHVAGPRPAGRITLVLDAGLAFGSGEHASTRGVLLALEYLAPRRPRRILDLGTGSGILALAAARLWHRPIVAADNDPAALTAARSNARANGLAPRIRLVDSVGWRNPALHRRRYDLVLANIFAHPLCAMAHPLAQHLAHGGHAVLAGFLTAQAPMVLAAHRRVGLV
ncbi:MAG: 50S ribosomal protein L11 methyltransferase, partial [Acetobacteraceae bacterium]